MTRGLRADDRRKRLLEKTLLPPRPRRRDRARLAARAENDDRVCREYYIYDSLLRKWREQFFAADAERLSGKTERTEAGELRRQISRLKRALRHKTMEVEVAGNSCGSTFHGSVLEHVAAPCTLGCRDG